MKRYKKTIIILFIIIGIISYSVLLNSCKSSSLNNEEITELQSLKKIFIDTNFDNSIIVNNKHILYDLTSDYFKYNKIVDLSADIEATNEASSDLVDVSTDFYIDESKYIFEKKDIERISFYESKFKNYTKQSISKLLMSKDLTIDVVDLSSDALPNSFVLSVKCIKYQIGEFNYITNLPSKMDIEAVLYKKGNKNEKNKQYITFKRSYKSKSDIAHSIEIMRINNISNKLAASISNLIIKYKSKKQQFSNKKQKTTDKKTRNKNKINKNNKK